jgi:hypothetical protein
MLSVSVRVPIYRNRKQRPELAQAATDLARLGNETQSQTQQVNFDIRTEYETAQKTAELLNIYRDGLLPQTRAEFQGGLAAYENNHQEFQPLLSSFLDVLHLDEEYWQNVAEREMALAQLEELTGLELHEALHEGGAEK